MEGIIRAPLPFVNFIYTNYMHINILNITCIYILCKHILKKSKARFENYCALSFVKMVRSYSKTQSGLLYIFIWSMDFQESKKKIGIIKLNLVNKNKEEEYQVQ